MTFVLIPQRRRLLGAAVVGLFVSVAVGSASAAGVVDVTIDFAKVLKVDGVVGTVVIGNPGIADASVQDKDTLVLTGRAAGTTNLIVLDPAGKELENATLRVSSNVQQLTTIFFGGERRTFSCAPVCEQVISVGDSKSSFDDATAQIQTRQEFANPK